MVRTRRRRVTDELLSERHLEVTQVELRDEELAVLREVEAATALEVEERVAGPDRARRAAASSWRALYALPNLEPPLRAALAELGPVDSKVEALCDLLGELWSQDPTRKIVIRTFYEKTRRMIVDRLRSLLLDGALRGSIEEELEAWEADGSVGPVALLQESQDSIIDLLRKMSRGTTSRANLAPGARGQRLAERIEEIDLRSTMLAQLRSFEVSSAGGACVLVANDVAGTGLNLQFASDLILYDVPWRPQVAEQWIGRLDRLGRRGANRVRIHVLSHPSAPDWELIELYRVLGVFGAGLHVPPEVADEIDGLIDRADAGQLGWSHAIGEARAILGELEGGDDDDVLLDALEPDPALGRDLAERCFGRPGEASGSSSEVLEALTHLGFGFERIAPRAHMVQLAMTEDRLALREVRHALRPRRPDPIAGPPRLNVDLERLPLGAAVRERPSQFLSPQHPLVTELRRELELDAGVRFGVYEVDAPPALLPLAGGWVACGLARTFPAAAATAALWESEVTRGLEDEELLRLCEIVEAGLGRALSFAFPPLIRRSGVLASLQAGRLRFTGRELDDPQIDALLQVLPSGRPANQIPEGTDVAFSDLERHLTARAHGDPSRLSPCLFDVTAFVADERRRVLARREKTTREWRARAGEAGGNVGFAKIAEREEMSLGLAEAVLDRLSRIAADPGTLVTEAVRPRLMVAALVFLRSRR